MQSYVLTKTSPLNKWIVTHKLIGTALNEILNKYISIKRNKINAKANIISIIYFNLGKSIGHLWRNCFWKVQIHWRIEQNVRNSSSGTELDFTKCGQVVSITIVICIVRSHFAAKQLSIDCENWPLVGLLNISCSFYNIVISDSVTHFSVSYLIVLSSVVLISVAMYTLCCIYHNGCSLRMFFVLGVFKYFL